MNVWNKNLGKWLSIAMVIFCLIPQAEVPKKETFGSVREFFQNNPLQSDDLIWSTESGKSIRFTSDEKWQIVLLGKLKAKSILVIDNIKITPNEKGDFQFPLVLSLREETHELTLRSEQGNIKSYPFKIQLIRDPPKPLRAKIRVDKDKVITKGLFLEGTFPTEHWLGFTWLEPSQKIDPDVVKALQAAEKEREKQEREKREKELVELREKERAKREEEEKQRELAAEIQRASDLEVRLAVRDPSGWKFDYGLGILNLDQQGVGKMSSTNWTLGIGLDRPISDKIILRANGQGFLFPLSVENARTGPRWIRLGLEASYDLVWGGTLEVSPTMGLGYQSLSSNESFGYRAMAGPKVGLLSKLSLGPQSAFKTELSLTVFGEPRRYLSLENTEMGVKTLLEFKASSGFFSNFYVGGEMRTIRLRLNSGATNGTVYSGFLGIGF